MNKPYLALFRAGSHSLHRHAVERLSEQNFDYALSWFGDVPPPDSEAIFVHQQKGPKWAGLQQTIEAYWDVIQTYRYIWLPDDDLLCKPEEVSRMFVICDDLNLELAQPALTPDSYYSHLITLRHPEFQLRFTNFVEIMAPIFSTAMLARIFPTLTHNNMSGYGLDAVWPHYSQLGKVAIIDETPVQHTRPVGGPNYIFNQQTGLAPAHEDWLMCARYGIEQAGDFHINYAGLLQSGEPLAMGNQVLEIDRFLKSLIQSCSGQKVSAVHLTRYLSNHLCYWNGEASAGVIRYPRGLLRIVLNQALAAAGIHFAAPPEVAQSPAVGLIQQPELQRRQA